MRDTSGDHDQRHSPGSRGDAGRAADSAAGEPGGGDEQEWTGEGEQQLRCILVRVERAVGHNVRDALLLRLACLDSDPGTERERRGDSEGDRPRAERAGTFPDCPERAGGEDWQKQREHHREVNHRGVQGIGQHCKTPSKGSPGRCAATRSANIRHWFASHATFVGGGAIDLYLDAPERGKRRLVAHDRPSSRDRRSVASRSLRVMDTRGSRSNAVEWSVSECWWAPNGDLEHGNGASRTTLGGPRLLGRCSAMAPVA